MRKVCGDWQSTEASAKAACGYGDDVAMAKCPTCGGWENQDAMLWNGEDTFYCDDECFEAA